jgi:hypothetical protein
LIREIRHELGLPLLTRREKKVLDGLWWGMVAQFSKLMLDDMTERKISLEDRMAMSAVIVECLDGIKEIEDMKA